MRIRVGVAVSILMLFCVAAQGKDKKKKVVLPADVLEARTAWVLVDRDSGVDVRNPNANNIARSAVETALAKWGRLKPVTDPSLADLVIVIRKGNGKMVQPTIGGSPVNAPPPIIGQRTDSGIDAAGRTGRPMGAGDPHPQMEVGGAEDTFMVYRGNRGRDGEFDPTDAPTLWRYMGRDALEAPEVPAVEAFRKAIAEAEKQAAKP